MPGHHRQIGKAKATREEAELSLAQHLHDATKHGDPKYTWDESKDLAVDGVTEQDYEEEIWVDEAGNQHVPEEVKEKIKEQKRIKAGGGKGGNSGGGKGGDDGKGRRGGKGGGGGHGRGRDNRARSRGRDDHRDRGRDDRRDRGRDDRDRTRIRDRSRSVPITGSARSAIGNAISNSSHSRQEPIQVVPMQRAPNGSEVIISRTELDTLIDCFERSLQSMTAVTRILEGALTQFQKERETVQQCKFALERYRRAT